MVSDIQLYGMKNEYMSKYYPEVGAEELYADIFPLDSMEKKGDMSARSANPIFTYRDKRVGEDGKEYAFFRNEIVFADHFKESIQKTYKNDLALCSMCTYSGRRKTAKNAYQCHGFIIDLDGVGMLELESFWGWVENLKHIPYPTYVANSGHGLHIYYVFENPVPLFPNVVEHLQQLKRGLTDWVWNKETSNYKPQERQYQGIYQSFRMIGSKTKLGSGNARSKYLVKAWKTGKKVTIEYLNGFVEDIYKCPTDPDYSSWEWASEHYSLEECRKMFPEWYEKRIINKEPAGQWKCNKGLYDWWLRKIQENGNAMDGNRYHCISMLYVYAIKCMIPKEIVDADAMDLIAPFNELTKRSDNEFTVYDIECASAFYKSRYAKISKREVERKTKIRIEPCRRNGQKRAEHLEEARAIRDIRMKRQGKDWREGNGRPKGSSKQKDIVIQWKNEHPNGKKADCIRETGLSKPTVYKWWEET